MAEKDVAPAARTMEQLVSAIKRDLLWLLVSMGVAMGAALAVNTFVTI